MDDEDSTKRTVSHDEFARVVYLAIRNARLDALEEAAQYCDSHAMGVGHRKLVGKFAGYVSEPFDPNCGGRHSGNGYAAALRALKDK